MYGDLYCMGEIYSVHVFLQGKGRFVGSSFCPAKFFRLYSVYYYCISSQCDNKASEDSTPVHVLALEGGAGTEISSQHPVADLAVMTIPGMYCNDYFHNYTTRAIICVPCASLIPSLILRLGWEQGYLVLMLCGKATLTVSPQLLATVLPVIKVTLI